MNRRLCPLLSCLAATAAFGAYSDNAQPARRPSRVPPGALSGVAPEQDTPAAAISAPVGQISRKAISDYITVGFDQLAGFSFKTPELQPTGTGTPSPDVLAQVPAGVRDLDGRKVIITGFMLPLKIEKGVTTEFLLLNSQQMCCFGVALAPNAWIEVKMPRGVPAVQDVPTAFCGRLHVKANWENGWLSSIYQLEGEGSVRL